LPLFNAVSSTCHLLGFLHLSNIPVRTAPGLLDVEVCEP